MKKYYNNMMEGMAKASRKAMDNIVKLTGAPVDHELRMYENMKPIDFDRLRQIHGVDTITGYIKDMELRRLKEKTNGD
jgi:hypothetical protein